MKENSASLVGKLVWAPHPELVWVPGTVRHADSLTVEVETVDKEFLRLAVKDLKDSTLIIAHANSLQNFQNLIDMEEFNEGAIIHQLRTRYKQDDIYTWIGNILISINPYKLLPIYTSEVLRKYIDLEKHGGATGLQNYAPHAYSVSGMAYKGLSLDENAQAVIISGESGAGKTEVTKLILQYLSEVAGSASGVEQEILLTNPILEAFGNSKTLRNNNSSRFGKWMEIIFDSSCRISGARIVNYLLEKSRVIKQAQNERNYHIFYQICSGAQGKTHLCLGDPSKFNYLNQSGCLTIAGVDDESGYQNVINAFKRLSFSEFELDEIHKIIAAILHLGNVEFEVKDNEGSKISNPEELDLVSKLLQLKSSDLEQAICYRAVKFRNDITQIPLKIADANDARHTIAKTLFGRLFDWLILKINDRLCKSKDTRVIGVLDIFGFEVFETNSFEQFCINFANEKLQSHFTQHIFLLEQNEYSSEGIPVDHVEFSDNSECIDIIEGNPGIIRLLDEEVVIPKGSDQALVEKLHRQFFPDEKSRHPKYSLIRKKKHIFIISHYAGDVEYDSNTNWLEKNKDRLHQSLGLAIKKSGSIIISNLFMDVSDADMDEKKVTGTIKVKSKGKDTLGTQFKKQLDNLMTTLKLAEPHFIRCLKPNYEKAADEFKSELVLRQIRYAGLFEAIRIRASGFTFRKPLHIFLKNYIVFLPAEHREVLQNIDDPTSARDGCQLILNLHESELNLHEIKLGHTKIFYKASQLEILESIRDRIILKHVISTQAKVRGALGRKRFKTIKHFFNKCKEALQNRDRSEIQDIMNSCAEQGLELFILAELRDLDQYLEVQDRVIQSVKEAIETSNIDRLEGALHQVDKLEIKKNSKESHVMKIIQQAEDELSRLKKLYQSKQQLRAAIENDDIETLSIAIEEARALGVDAEIIEQARSAKTELERQATVMSNVNRLLSTKCASDLDKFLKSELDTIKLTAERRVMIQQAEDFLLETFSNQILDFISREDEDSVLQLMKDIRESYIWPKSTEIIAKGRDFISQMQHRRDVLAEQQLQQAEAVEIEEEEEEGEAPPTVEAPREIHASTPKEEIFVSANTTEGIIPSHSKMKPAWKPPLPSGPPPKKSSAVSPPKIPAKQVGLHSSIQASVSPPRIALKISSDSELPPPIPSEDDLFELPPPIPDDYELHERGSVIAPGINNPQEETALIHDLRIAIAELDREQMGFLLNRARKINASECKEIMRAKELCYGISDAQFVDLKLQQALNSKQTMRIKGLLAEANKAGLNSMNFNLAKQFISQKLDEARERIEKIGSFRDYSHKMSQYRDFMSLKSFKLLRDPKDFFRKGLFSNNQKTDLSGMYQCSSEPIFKSMMEFSPDYCSGKQESSQCREAAIFIFNDILFYMKFKFHSYPQTLAPSIIERGINEPLLRDEIFCQLIKQTTENPNVLSMSLALKLMYLCLLSFRPTQKDLIEILKSHLASLTGGIITKFTTFDLAEDLAARCFELLSKPLPNFLAISQDESRMFYELSSEKLHVSVVLRESRKSEKKSKKEKYMDDVVVNVPKISSELARFLLHDDVNITADDLSNTLSHKLKIPFVGYIKLQNYPSRLHLPEDGLIDGNTNLIQLIELLKNYGAEKSTSWLLVCEDSGEELADDVSQMHNLVIHSLEDVLGAPPPVSPKHGDDLDDNDASAAQHSMFGGNKLKDEEILLKEELRRKAEEAEASRLEEIHRQDELAKTLKAEEHARALEDARKKKERMELEDRENLARQAAAEKLEQVKKLKERASKLRSRTGAASSNFGSSGDISSFREGGTLRSTRVKRPVRQLTRTLRN